MTFTFDMRALERNLGKFRENLRRRTAAGFRQHGAFFERVHSREVFTAYPGPGSEDGSRDQLYSRSGQLRGSSRSEIVPDGSTYRLISSIGAGAPARYVRIQEEGGIVRGNPYLTIPIADNLTPSGVPRYPSAAELRKTAETFIINPNGTPLIALKKGDGFELLWALKRSIKIKPRLRWVDTWERNPEVLQHRVRVLSAILREALRDTLGRAAVTG